MLVHARGLKRIEYTQYTSCGIANNPASKTLG
jgi:glucosamine 6-phosphate synthetase-like amidotransferase/phosphosugar isomerase protein